MRGAARARAAVVPDWLAEIARLRRAPVPWADMVRAGIATCGPLAVAFAVGQRGPGELIAMGGLLGTLVDKGAPYAARVKRVGSAAVFGGAAGLTLGSFLHGPGWVAGVGLGGVAGGVAGPPADAPDGPGQPGEPGKGGGRRARPGGKPAAAAGHRHRRRRC